MFTNILRISLTLVGAAVALFAQTGPTVPELAPLDRALTSILAKYKIPGAALAVAKDGRLVYARGFGTADIETGEPVQPDSLFRVASVSKPITAVGVLKLVEDGKITLDTKVLSYLGRKAAADPRWSDITVRHLLQHSGGLDIFAWGFDPSFPDRATLLGLGAPLPPSRSDVLDFVLANLPLASAPGTKFAYSNVGYMLLTEVVEKASGQKYETFMREKILAPLGIYRMRIAGSLLTERRPGEVRYSDGDNVDQPIFPGLPATVPLPYGTFNLSIFESGGGWLATAPDLVRFLTAFDSGSLYPLLRPETVRLMLDRPAFFPPQSTAWYGLGWSINNTTSGQRWDHDGALQGTSAWMVRGINGISLAIAANTLPTDDVIVQFLNEVEGSLYNAAANFTSWPSGDTFPVYFPAKAPRIADAGVVNAASLRPGPVAPGSVVKIFGVNLAGAQVRVNGGPVPVLWTSDNELHVRIPESVAGQANIQADLAGLSSNIAAITVQPAAPAIFTASRNGYGQAAALNQDSSLNSANRPAPPDSIAVVYATGAGNPEVTLGGVPAQVLFSGPAPGLPPGVTQINLRIPANLPTGDSPLRIKSGQTTSPLGVTLAIR